jgi:hypothetical protein
MTATGKGWLVGLFIFTNTQQFQGALTEFLNSLQLAAAPVVPPKNTSAAPVTSIVGLWGYYQYGYQSFAFGSFYLRHEYEFKEDGTYRYLQKDYVGSVLFGYETGTWAIQGNQLTITPTSGKSQEWSAPNGWAGYGSLKSTSPRKLEKITYTFDLHFFRAQGETHLLLSHDKPTERDGPIQKGAMSFVPPNGGKSEIDLPPGFQWQ